jgi:hypothetical protein
MRTLRDITKQESGIVIYGNQVIVCNWASTCPTGGLPIMTPFDTVMEYDDNDDDDLKSEKNYRVKDIRTVLPGTIVIDEEKAEVYSEGMDILYDVNGDIPALWGFEDEDTPKNMSCILRNEKGELIPTSGTVYHIGEVIVIAPDGWA